MFRRITAETLLLIAIFGHSRPCGIRRIKASDWPRKAFTRPHHRPHGLRPFDLPVYIGNKASRPKRQARRWIEWRENRRYVSQYGSR